MPAPISRVIDAMSDLPWWSYIGTFLCSFRVWNWPAIAYGAWANALAERNRVTVEKIRATELKKYTAVIGSSVHDASTAAGHVAVLETNDASRDDLIAAFDRALDDMAQNAANVVVPENPEAWHSAAKQARGIASSLRKTAAKLIAFPTARTVDAPGHTPQHRDEHEGHERRSNAG